MTGFGEGQSYIEGVTVYARVRSVNHRFLDLSIRVPAEMSSFQTRAERLMRDRFLRGHLDVVIRVEGNVDRQVGIDHTYVRRLWASVCELGEAYPDCRELPRDVLFRALLAQSGRLCHVEGRSENEALEEAAASALGQAIDGCKSTCRSEGQTLADDIERRLHELASAADRLEVLCCKAAGQAKERLAHRLLEVCQEISVDISPERLTQEFTAIVHRNDVTEEIVRLRAHVGRANKLLEEAQGGEDAHALVGRKLEFLFQEILRELNTTGAKSIDAEVSGLVVDAKAEIERLREQVANLA